MKRLLRILIIITLIILALNYISYGFVICAVNAIKLDDINKPNIIEFYDNNDELFYTLNTEYQGQYVEYNKINKHLINSFIVIEDKDYFEHNGLDLLRIIKASITNIKHGEIKQGASTISQQTARILYLNNEKSYLRKIKEAYLAIYLEENYSKEKILELYLNGLFFGENIYGISEASLYYFNKDQKELNIAEASYLAAIINSPNTYLKEEDNKSSLERKNLVLKLLNKYNYIDYSTYIDSLNYKLTIIKKENIKDSNIKYYIEAIISYLKEHNLYNKHNLLKGMKIYTNIDLKIAKDIDTVINKYQEELKELETSIVILKPNSSKVLMIQGGKDYSLSNLNRPLSSNRQVGSLIKPLLYYLGLINDFTPVTKLESKKTTFKIKDYGEYSPKNYNDVYPNREITLLEAIATSDNIYAVKLGLHLGSENFKEAIKFFTKNEVKALPSLFLGSNEMNLMELASMYNTFASLGDYYTPYFYSKILDFNDKEISKKGNNKKTLLLKKYATVLNQALLSPFDKNINECNKPTMLNYKPKVRYSAKSGSTNSDSYVIGYNPNYVVAVWCGSDEGKKIDKSPTKKIFLDLANTLAKYEKEKWYEPTKNVEAKKIDPITGLESEYGSIYYLIKR